MTRLFILIFIISLSVSFFRDIESENKTPGIETRTIRDTKNLITLSSLEWEPYIGRSLKNNGYVYEIVVEAFKRSGYRTEVKFYPWARALYLTQAGKYDALFPSYYNESRARFLAFSNSFTDGPVGFYKRKDSNIKFRIDPRKNIKVALRGLKEYSIGIVRGYINTPEFDRADYLKKEEAVSDKINLKKLINKRIDLIFINKYVAIHMISTYYPNHYNNLEFMEPALENKKLYVCFSKKRKYYREKLNAFNRGLHSIKKDGTLTKIMKNHGF